MKKACLRKYTSDDQTLLALQSMIDFNCDVISVSLHPSPLSQNIDPGVIYVWHVWFISHGGMERAVDKAVTPWIPNR